MKAPAGLFARMLVLLLLATAMPAGGEATDFLVPPGYRPGPDAKMDERGIWMEMDEQEQILKRSPLILRDDLVVDYVESLVCHVAGPYCPDIRVYVIRNPYFNASMAPNGVMLIHTGLLARVESSDQLASIIGHELVHFTQKHSLLRLRAAKSGLTAATLLSMGLAVGGVNSGGLPELFAIASIMGFTREQESEADLLGVRFMQDSGHDPSASYWVWVNLQREEANASIPFPKGPLFLSSHPSPERRAQRLAELASQLTPAEGVRVDAFLSVLQSSYAPLLDEQVLQGDYGRLSTILDRHERLGVRHSDLAFYRGEAWRVRRGAGDHERAIKEYIVALSGESANPRAHRELGYLYFKHGDQDLAKQHFRAYLDYEPNASDREMIEFYIAGGWQ